jgi:hypothetical protein
VLVKCQDRDPDEAIIFINAWNEWAEGNHLEPDLKFGRGYLEATKRALNRDALARPAAEALLLQAR